MKVLIEGNINRYYVQTLCMIFFPGAKFPENEEESPNIPVMDLKLVCDEEKAVATAVARLGDRCTEATREYTFLPERTEERTRKLAVGAAVIGALGELMHYKPSWGMLVGVRPSKVAMEMLNAGVSKTRVKKILTSDFLVTPKKAGLAVDVARKEKQIIGVPDGKDCSIYVSIPFCPSRCSYCSFVSYTSNRLLALIPEYLVRLCEEIRSVFSAVKQLGLRVRTVYIGGGTPTILDNEMLRTLLATIAGEVDPASLEELTLEAGRPDTITAEKFAIAKEYGVTRVSVNAQSLSDGVLSGVGRGHSADDFFRAYHIARESGIHCINTDLIAGLPGDKFPTFAESFDKVIDLAPENITVHTFSVKRASDILREDKRVYSITGGDVGKCVDYSQLRSLQADYVPYYMYRQKNTVGNFENMGFSKEGFEGLYNVYMMEEVHSIFAAGAGAVTKLVDYGGGENGKIKIERVFNPKYPYEYLREDEKNKTESAILGYYEKKGF